MSLPGPWVLWGTEGGHTARAERGDLFLSASQGSSDCACVTGRLEGAVCSLERWVPSKLDRSSSRAV